MIIRRSTPTCWLLSAGCILILSADNISLSPQLHDCFPHMSPPHFPISSTLQTNNGEIPSGHSVIPKMTSHHAHVNICFIHTSRVTMAISQQPWQQLQHFEREGQGLSTVKLPNTISGKQLDPQRLEPGKGSTQTSTGLAWGWKELGC